MPPAMTYVSEHLRAAAHRQQAPQPARINYVVLYLDGGKCRITLPPGACWKQPVPKHQGPWS